MKKHSSIMAQIISVCVTYYFFTSRDFNIIIKMYALVENKKSAFKFVLVEITSSVINQIEE